MTVRFQDEYESESGDVDLDAHTPDTEGDGYGIVFESADPLIVDDSAAVCRAQNTDSADELAIYYVEWTTAPSDDEYFVEYHIVKAPRAAGYQYSYTLRDSDVGNFYDYLMEGVSNGNDELILNLLDGGPPSTLGTVTDLTFPTDGSTEHLIRGEAFDATKRMFYDDTQEVSSTNNAVTGVGVSTVFCGGEFGKGMHIDFEVTHLYIAEQGDTIPAHGGGPSGRIMSSLVGAGGLASKGGLASDGGGLAAQIERKAA